MSKTDDQTMAVFTSARDERYAAMYDRGWHAGLEHARELISELVERLETAQPPVREPRYHGALGTLAHHLWRRS